MTYQHFVHALARQVRQPDAATFLESPEAKRYAFALSNRERGRALIKRLEDHGITINFSNVLDIGCAYAGNLIEMRLAGASGIGIDIDEKWLALAKQNARDECSINVMLCDASTREARERLKPFGPFDLVIVNDVFEHVYDTAALLENISSLITPNGRVFYQVPNGLATRAVMSEGHKKIFGISLLPPDYWSHFTPTPFHIYYRRWSYFNALFNHFGFRNTDIAPNHDEDLEWTRRKLQQDLREIREAYEEKVPGYNVHQARFMEGAMRKYEYELRSDLNTMGWEDLMKKYRQHFWEGILSTQQR